MAINMDIYNLPQVTEANVQLFRPGVRYYPSNVELLAFLHLYKSNPAGFKSANIFPVFEKTVAEINPDEIHDKCQLHESHLACIFLAGKDTQKKRNNVVYDDKSGKNVLCEVDRIVGKVVTVKLITGDFRQQWTPWTVEELTLHNPSPPLKDTVIYRAFDTSRLAKVMKVEYLLLQGLFMDDNDFYLDVDGVIRNNGAGGSVIGGNNGEEDGGSGGNNGEEAGGIGGNNVEEGGGY